MDQHKERLDRAKLRTLFAVAFLTALNAALLAYFNSSYIATLIAEKYIGLIFTLGYIIALLLITNFSYFIDRFGKVRVFLYLIFFNIVCLLLVSLFATKVFSLLFFIFYLVTLPLIFVNMDILVETFSKDAVTGRIRGIQYVIMNFGWVISPILAGYLLQRFGFSFMFFLGALVLLPAIFIIWKSLKIDHHPSCRRHRLVSGFKRVFKNKALRSIFYIAFLLSFFYAWVVIYVPIWLRNLEYSWEQIGLIYSIILIPFVILQYPVGYLADKYWGETELLTFGLIVLAVSTGALFFTTTPWLLVLLLFCTRIGASIVELLRDSYFFKQIDANDIELIDLFRDTWPLAYIVAPTIASLSLIFFPIHYLFLFLGIFLLSGLYFSLTMPDTK